MTCLGDTKTLQLGERRYYQALDIVSLPTMQGPQEMVRQLREGGINEHVATDDKTGELKPIYGNWSPDLAAMEKRQMVVEERIKRSFYEDLFLMISQSDRRQITAEEIMRKQEEKLLMIGPVLERLHSELLDPLIDRTYNILNDAGVLPVPPRELQDTELEVEYVSVLAQAQRMVSVSGLERVAGFASNLANLWPEARHKVNATEMVDDYADAIGVNPKTIRSDQDVEAIRKQEQQAALREQQAEGMAQAAEMAKTASQADTTEGNALSTLMERMGLQG